MLRKSEHQANVVGREAATYSYWEVCEDTVVGTLELKAGELLVISNQPRLPRNGESKIARPVIRHKGVCVLIEGRIQPKTGPVNGCAYEFVTDDTRFPDCDTKDRIGFMIDRIAGLESETSS